MSNQANYSMDLYENEKINNFINNTNNNNKRKLLQNNAHKRNSSLERINYGQTQNDKKIYKYKNNKSQETKPLFFSLSLAMDALIKFAYAPVERLQILQQVQPVIPEINNRPSFKHIPSAFKTIIKEQGVDSLWRGATIGLIRFIPSHISNYIIECYDSTKTKKKSNKNSKIQNENRLILNNNNNVRGRDYNSRENINPPLTTSIINTLKWLNGKSNLSVAVSMALGYPLTLTRVRLAADVGTGKSRKFKSINDCLCHIYHQGGIMCMYQGWIESYLAYILYNFTVKTAYKQSMNHLYGKNMSRPPLWKQWFIGQLVTRTAYIFIYPLETVKLRLMMQAGEKNLKYRHGWECLWRIIRDEGFISLYKGIDVVLISEIFGWGVILSSGLIMDWLVGKLIGPDKKNENKNSSHELTKSRSHRSFSSPSSPI